MPTSPHCFAIVLAAGRATRFGDSKLLEEFENTTLIERAVTLAASACGPKTLLVVGHDRDRVRAAAGPNVVAHTVNDRYAKGLSTSIVCAIEAIEHCAQAVLILLADQVGITEDHLQNLLNSFDGRTAVSTAYAGSVGPPAIFSRAQFTALKGLQGDVGAKQLLTSGAFPIITVDFEPAAIDIDTRDDLLRIP